MSPDDQRTTTEDAGRGEDAGRPPEQGGEAAEAPGPSPEAGVAAAVDVGELRERVIAALKTVYDPEIPVNVYELGLIYDVEVTPAGAVHVTMTLTTPNCPEAGFIPPRIEERLSEVPGVAGASVEVVWDPPWTPDRMSEAARLELNIF